MNLKARIAKLETQGGDRPGPEMMPGASAEEVALALLGGSLSLEDIDRDPRRVEAVTMTLAARNVAASHLADPTAYRAPMSCPRLITAWEGVLAKRAASAQGTVPVPDAPGEGIPS